MASVRQQSLVDYGRKAVRVASRFGPSLYFGLKNKASFDDLERFVFFIGFPRSGSSLVGAILDAHPDVVIGLEMGLFMYVRAGFVRHQICHEITRNAQRAAARRSSGGYSYVVPEQWQGRWRRLRVMGDKHAGGATMRLAAMPDLLDRLRATVQVPLRVIQVVRNPFDNIATMHRKAIDHKIATDLDAAIAYYRYLCAGARLVRGRLDHDEFCLVRHEALVTSPELELSGLCHFLNVDAEHDYLASCRSIINAKPRRTRLHADWSADQRRAVEAIIHNHPVLEGYRFDD